MLILPSFKYINIYIYLQLVLTAKGVANWMFVVKVIMQYLGHVSRQGPQKWIFDELQRVAQLEYVNM